MASTRSSRAAGLFRRLVCAVILCALGPPARAAMLFDGDPGSAPSTQGNTGSSTPDCLWDSGPFDQRTAQFSTASLYLGEQQTADDVYIPVGCMSRWNKITATLVGSSLLPKARLRIYDDCDGKPGTPLFTMDTINLVDTGQTFAGQKVWTVEFDPSQLWLTGGDTGHVYWVSVMGIEVFSGDQWFWATAGSGIIAGVPGMYRAVSNGVSDWASVASFGCGCTDFVLRVQGNCCKILWDNGGPEDPIAASGSLSIIDNPGTTARTADNFEVPPCQDALVCFLRAVVYSNCVPFQGRFEIYENECTLPVTGNPLYTVPFSRSLDLGYSVVIGGISMRAYEVQAYDMSWLLPGGATYWIVAAGQGGGTILERSYFAFSTSCKRCPIRLSEGVFASAGRGLPEWTPVDQVIGTARDFSFMVAVQQQTSSSSEGQRSCPADFNRDGTNNVQDLLDYLNAWFQGCP